MDNIHGDSRHSVVLRTLSLSGVHNRPIFGFALVYAQIYSAVASQTSYLQNII